MKKYISSFVLLLIVSCSFVVAAGVRGERSMRSVEIMSYNIRGGVGMDNVRDLKRTAAVVQRAAADVVAVQEVDSMTGRSARRDILAELGALTSMYPTYARAIDYDGGAYGIGILSKEKPLRSRRVPLPGREEARVLLIAEFADYVVMATHFSLTDEDQCTSIALIDSLAATYTDKALFLLGDLNFEPDAPQFKLLRRNFVLLSDSRRHTFPANQPDKCIDYIWGYVGGAQCYKTVKGSVVDAPVESDHRPIVATVRHGDIMRTSPYLQNPTDGGVTVSWLTNTSAYSWVEYGTDSNDMQRARTLFDGQVLAGNDLNKIRLSGLKPGATYYYRVCSREMLYYGAYEKTFGGTQSSPIYSFTTPSDDAEDFTAMIFNDLHQRRATAEALVEAVKKGEYLPGGKPSFVIFNGDCIDDPSSRDQALGTLAYFNDVVGAESTPVFYMRGNHEIRGAFSVGLRDLFDYVGGRTYGAFNWGDTRFVMLDCGEDKPDSHPVYYDLNDFEGHRRDQADFLRREMRSDEFRAAGRRVLLHHIPIYGWVDDYNPCRDIWGPIFAAVKKPKQNFDIAINGHMHEFASYKVGEKENPFPMIVGGGPSMESATVTILERRAGALKARVIDATGKVLLDLDL